jgi:hypothetical protein
VRTSLRLALLAIATATAASGCSTPTDRTPYPGACWPLEPVQWTPAGSSVGVPTDTVVRVRFDDYPDPDTVGSDSLVLTTGFYWVPATHKVDLIEKTVIIRPWAQLSSNLGYTIHLQPTLHSLQGCATTETIRSFRTGDSPSGGEPAPVIPPFTDVQAIFDQRCGTGCHLGSRASEVDHSCVAKPAAGLSLCARDAFDALVDVPSRAQSDLPLVDPGNAARSVLFRKLISATPGGAPPPPTIGHRDPPGMALERPQIDAIAAWIDGGAMR